MAAGGKGRSGERGMALLFVLLVVTLLSAMVIELSYEALVDLRLAETFRDRTRAGYIARGGIVAGQMFMREDSNGFDALTELWAQGLSDFPVDEGAVSIRIVDLDGRLDVNRLVTSQGNPDAFFRDRFERLFETLGGEDPVALSEALIDWLDPDDDALAYGAESDYYQSLEPSYLCKNGPLYTLDELAQVKGFSSELLTRLRPHVTLHGSSKVNINTVTPEVLASLGENMTLSDARETVELVRAKPLTNVTQLQEISGSEVWYSELRPHLQVTSDHFRVRSRGTINDAVRFASAEIGRTSGQVYYLRLE
ncbi:MAG: hypothetical protein C0624_02085 [Desulfuromonas sp.]|nr:MAG: hypothetical protein C0624_02085 [Desulfuromonas sp.]